MNINLSLDMDRVQSSVQAAIRPSVEKALVGKDVEKAIAKALKQPLADDPYSMMFGRRQSAGTLLDQMINDGIKEIAQHYVNTKLMEQKSAIVAALEKSMAESTSRLTKSFVKAVEKAFASDWGFDLAVSVAHKEKERSDDY